MSWPKVNLEQIASVKGGKRLPKGHNFTALTTDHPYIRARDIGNNRITITEPVYITDHTFNKIKSYTVSEGNLVITIVGANIGDIGYITDEFDGANLTENAAKLHVNRNLCDPRFLSAQLSTARAKKKFQILTGGSAQGKLGLYKIKLFEAILPPLPIQTNIVSVLSAYDDLIENNRRRIQLLEQAARLLYKEWFVHLRFPGHEHVKIKDGVPEGWEKKKIADVCETVGGGTPSTKVPEYWAGDITWVVPSDITKNNCLVLLDSERKITEKGLQKSSAKMVPAETILMTSRASVGFFALMDYEICTNQGFINIIPHEDEMRMYLLFNLMSRVEEIRSNSKGTTYPEISKGRFRDMGVVVPPNILVNEFAEFASDIIRQVRILKRSTQKLERARDLLLPRLMKGAIQV